MKHAGYRWIVASVAAVALGAWASAASAAYRSNVGYDELQSYLGAGNVPTAADIQVMQVEAQPKGSVHYMPNYGTGELAGKFFTNVSNSSNGTTVHATTVATNLDGNNTSIAPGIGTLSTTPILNYEANDYINNFLVNGGAAPLTTTARVANQSWIGDAGNANDNAALLARLDYTVVQDDLIQVVGLPNTPTGNDPPQNLPLWKDAYNAITVGVTSGNHLPTTVAVDSLYTASRVAPTLVAPESATSYATPIVSASAALLLDAAKTHTDWSTGTYTNRTRTITDGESSEVIKAVLMAGADRSADNVSGADLTDYTVDTDNGLDHRYGAGQVNIYNSYRILEGTEQHSAEDGNASDITDFGWDRDDHFGGDSGSNTTGTYDFIAAGPGSIIASLVWNLNVGDTEAGPAFVLGAAFYDLNLSLIDTTTNTTVASSLSNINNTENIWYDGLIAGDSYQLLVTANGTFDWDYGLAWRIASVPEPATLLLLLAAAPLLLVRTNHRDTEARRGARG